VLPGSGAKVKRVAAEPGDAVEFVGLGNPSLTFAFDEGVFAAELGALPQAVNSRAATKSATDVSRITAATPRSEPPAEFDRTEVLRRDKPRPLCARIGLQRGRKRLRLC